MADRIAILGWGSLLWDKRSDFDALHGPWQSDGPILKIEFSRVSMSRLGILTLVLDPMNGADNKVAYCLSRRSDLSQAAEDLRIREGTTIKNVGYIDRNGTARARDKESMSAIIAWASTQNLDSVVWTDLPSNFLEKTGKSFSLEAAMAYLDSLENEAGEKAREYMHKTPEFIRTPLREAFRSR